MLPLVRITGGSPATRSGALLALAVLLIAAVSTLTLGLNAQLTTFIPLHFGKIGKAATVAGVLNASSYAAAALSDFFAGVLSKHSGWTVTLFAFLLTAATGAVFCIVGAGRWGRGRELTVDNGERGS